MFQLFRHLKGKLKGKFDIVFVKGKNVIVFSNQGYERRSKAIAAIWLVNPLAEFQDDTTTKGHTKIIQPSRWKFVAGSRIPVLVQSKSPKKLYVPNSQKTK